MSDHSTKIAIVGMAGRFPGAQSVDELWTHVVRSGTEAVQRYEHEGRPAVGYGLVRDAALFDNEFFDMSPGEAQSVTPEHRLFLEFAWAALENAGIDVTSFDGFISAYASASNHSAAYLRRILRAVDSEQLAGVFGVLLGNAMDSIATRVGYKLGLRGECITVQTHCSSSLVAVHLACQSLLSGHSDVALAGGVSVRASVEEDQEEEFSQLAGGQEGFILSPQGQCLALMEGATGTVSGDGVGVVVLKRLEDALHDGNHVYAVIAGTGINNDGRRKVGFTAPSVEGVTDAIEDALAFADLGPEQIGYIECHGTGTDLGDAIELRALRRVFEGDDRDPDDRLHLGSLKANIGHLAAGAGVTGLIKAALVVGNGEIPPVTHAREHRPHPEIRDSSVLAVAENLSAWTPKNGEPRRAGVSSLGIGGTNIHVIVEEAPRPAEASAGKGPSALVWSAKTEAAADAIGRSLEATLAFREDADLAAVAHTLQVGRAAFPHRRALVAMDRADAVNGFRNDRVLRLPAGEPAGKAKIAFMFSGHGSQRLGMGKALFELSPEFEKTVQRAERILREISDFDLRGYLQGRATADSERTSHTQTAIVVFEVGLAAALEAWGLVPDIVLGSSLGEFSAACMAGSLSFEDMIRIVYARGELQYSVRGGAMVLFEADPQEQRALLSRHPELEEGIRVSPRHLVAAGKAEAIDRLAAELEARGGYHRRLPMEYAAHSADLDSIIDEFSTTLGGLTMKPPKIPYISNVTGAPMSDAELNDPRYWIRQMRETVQLERGLHAAVDLGANYLLEVGPGLGVVSFAKWNFENREGLLLGGTVAHPRSDTPDEVVVGEALAKAWLLGKEIQWDVFGASDRLVPLPSYPFQGRKFYLGEPLPLEHEVSATSATNRATRSADRTLPRNPLEEQIAAIWTAILGVEELGIDENFFDLGGDSLQATRVLGRIQTEISSQVSVQDIMEHRTVRAIGSVIESILTQDEGGGDESEYYCAFDLAFGDQVTTIYMTRDEYDQQGIPEGAENIRVLE